MPNSSLFPQMQGQWPICAPENIRLSLQFPYLNSGSHPFYNVMVKELLKKKKKVTSLHTILNECEIKSHIIVNVFHTEMVFFSFPKIFYYNIECYIMLLNLWISTNHIKITSHKVTISLVISTLFLMFNSAVCAAMAFRQWETSVLKFHEASKLNSFLQLDIKMALSYWKGNVFNISHKHQPLKMAQYKSNFSDKGVEMTELFKERISLKLGSPSHAWRSHWLHRKSISTL